MTPTPAAAAGPLQTHQLKAALRARLHRLRLVCDPNTGSFEVTSGSERCTTGNSGMSSRTTVGLQNSLLAQQVDGHRAVHGSYAAAGRLTIGKGTSASETVGNGRSTILTYTDRLYPVVGELTETVAVRDRWSGALGLVGTRSAAALRSWAGHVSQGSGRHLAPQPRPAAGRTRHVPGVLPHPMRRRTDDVPLHRFVTPGPDEVFLNGLRAPGAGLMHVLDHVYNGVGVSSGYVSATRDAEYVHRSLRMAPLAAAALDARYRWRYDLDVPGGIDVNGTLGPASPHPDRREVLFAGGWHLSSSGASNAC